jgi:hypothetical protein
MKLKSESGNAFELVVLRYEHPDITADRWDANWLVVSGTVIAGDQSWRFVDACVTAFELAELAEWLQAAAAGRAPREYVFTEPNLAFSYLDGPEPQFRVRFAHESAPPWLTDADARMRGLAVDFAATEANTASAVAELRNALIEFPIRGGAA